MTYADPERPYIVRFEDPTREEVERRGTAEMDPRYATLEEARGECARLNAELNAELNAKHGVPARSPFPIYFVDSPLLTLDDGLEDE